jgi:hypothetical protein
VSAGQRVRNRVAGRSDAHRGELSDFVGHTPRLSQHRQRVDEEKPGSTAPLRWALSRSRGRVDP